MTDKRKTCGYCGQKIPNEVKVNGYHWEQKEGYNHGHWVKDKRETKNVKVKKETC